MSHTCAYCKQPYTEWLFVGQIVCSEKCRDAYRLLSLEKEVRSLERRLRQEKEWRRQDHEASRRIILDLENRVSQTEAYHTQPDEDYPVLANHWVSRRKHPPVV